MRKRPRVRCSFWRQDSASFCVAFMRGDFGIACETVHSMGGQAARACISSSRPARYLIVSYSSSRQTFVHCSISLQFRPNWRGPTGEHTWSLLLARTMSKDYMSSGEELRLCSMVDPGRDAVRRTRENKDTKWSTDNGWLPNRPESYYHLHSVIHVSSCHS